MPQVPYQGSPSVAPQDQATPYRQVSTPIGAFGGDVAQAVSHLGQATESAGNEIFQRGYAMQELNEQAKANEAVTDYMKNAGQAESQYLSLEGNNAVQGYKGYQDQLGQLRDQSRQGLDSPLAQRFYDQQTRSMQGRMIISAGSHAAQQNKVYAISTSKARMEAAGDQMMGAPDSDDIAQANIDSIKTEAQHTAQLQGLSPDATDEAMKTAVSTQLSKRIQGLSKTEPIRAGNEMEKYIKSGDLNAADAGRLAGMIQNQTWGVGSRQISSSVMAGQTGAYEGKPISAEDAMPAILARESSGRYGIQVAVPKKDGSIDYALGGFGVMQTNLQSWLKQAGMESMSPEEFKNNIPAQQQLFKFKWNQYLNDKVHNPDGTGDRAAEMWFSGENSTPGNNKHDMFGTSSPQYIQDFHANLARNAPLQVLAQQARDSAQKQAPGDTVLADMSEQHTIAQYRQQQAIQREAEQDNENTVYNVLANGLPNGQLPTNVDELKSADPKVEAAYTAMDPKKQLQVQKALASTARGSVAESPETIKNWRDLYGMSQNDPDKFLEQDIFNMKLTNANKKDLFKLQMNVQKKADADPQVGHAMGVLQQQLTAAGLTDKKSEEYQQFTGALHDALKQQAQDTKKVITDEDVQKIGANLLRNMGGGGFSIMHPFTGSPGTPMYQTEVPDDYMEKALADPRMQGLDDTVARGIVQRAYVAQQYHNLYGKKTAAPAGPEAPIGR